MRAASILRGQTFDNSKGSAVSGFESKTGARPGVVDYTGSISKCDDQHVRTLLDEAPRANSNTRSGLSRPPGDQRCARRGLLWLAASQSSCRDAARRDGVRISLSYRSHETGDRIWLQEARCPREGADDCADSVARGQPPADRVFNLAALRPAYPIKRQSSAQRTQASQGVDTPEEPLPLTHWSTVSDAERFLSNSMTVCLRETHDSGYHR
jgi:hypothetical protein